jgi:aspartokinase-like uncharacterized kinase
MSNNQQIAVIKVGGSLLSLPQLPQRLTAIVRQIANRRPLIVCGGGASADIVRRWQSVHGISDEQAHWLALRAVSLNERLLVDLLPRATIAATCDELQAVSSEGRIPILAAERFVCEEEPRDPDPLPHDWSVTSDSIAAWVVRRLNGDRLVLLKSCDLPASISLEEAAARNFVDAYFPTCAAPLAVDWVNLRTDMPQLRPWRPCRERPPSSLRRPV